MALGLAALGFAIGVGLLLIVPMAREGKGIFAFLNRGANRPVIDTRARAFAGAFIPTPADARPELWRTPTVTPVFPSLERIGEMQSAARAVYNPAAGRPVLSLPPIADERGRAIISIGASFGVDEDARTPGPQRADRAEATAITIWGVPADRPEMSACTLAIREGTLAAISVVGAATLAECELGLLRLPADALVSFAVGYDLLPNHRARDGAWREGGVFGRTEVRIGLRAPPAG